MKSSGIGANRPNPALLQQQQAQMETLATKGATAIKRMSVPDSDKMMSQVSGTMGDIKSSMQGRLLRRSPKDLEKLIGDTHFNQTAASAERVAGLKEGIADESMADIEAALLAIAQAAEMEPKGFSQLVGRLQLVVAHEQAGSLKNLTKPQRAAVAKLTSGNLEGLAKQVGQELQRVAFDPVRKAVDAPS